VRSLPLVSEPLPDAPHEAEHPRSKLLKASNHAAARTVAPLTRPRQPMWVAPSVYCAWRCNPKRRWQTTWPTSSILSTTSFFEAKMENRWSSDAVAWE
jgi:hypothetical protein